MGVHGHRALGARLSLLARGAALRGVRKMAADVYFGRAEKGDS